MIMEDDGCRLLRHHYQSAHSTLSGHIRAKLNAYSQAFRPALVPAIDGERSSIAIRHSPCRHENAMNWACTSICPGDHQFIRIGDYQNCRSNYL